MTDRVKLDGVQKQLKKVPDYIRTKLLGWVNSVEKKGIHEVRKLKGYQDKLLKGERKGQRSIRLSRAYRAIYRETKDGLINLIVVEEVNKHDY